jgi:hypothetical protein
MKIYGYESLQALFKFSGAQATRRIPRVLQPFREESLFYLNSPLMTALTQEVNLNLKPARPSPRLRVYPSLRLGTRQTLPLQQHQRSS